MFLKYLVMAFLGAGMAFGAEIPSDIPDETNQTYHSGFGEAKPDYGHSLAPVVGYDPSYRFVYGAAYFYEGPGLSFGLDGNTNLNQVYQGHGHFTHRFAPGWSYDGKLAFIHGFQPYYGEGGETVASDLKELWGVQSSFKLRLLRSLGQFAAVGVTADYRGRTEEALHGHRFYGVAPNQTVTTFGLHAEIDSRVDKRLSNDGFVLNADWSQGIPSLNWPGNTAFSQFEGGFIVYKEILNEWVPDVVAAFRVSGGVSAGVVPFAFKYQLGGTDRLRGYLENRFRGDKYYLQQTELRFPIFRMVGGALALGFGDAGDRELSGPKMSYGIGLRIGLPPDWVSKIRIDVAWGHDQMGIFANYGQTF